MKRFTTDPSARCRALGFVPIPIAAFSLALWALLPTAATAGTTADLRRPLQVEFRLTQPVDFESSWTLLATPQAEGLEPIRQAVTGAQPISLLLPPNSEWEIGGECPGFWVKRQLLSVEPGEQPLRIVVELWSLGTLRGSLRVAEKGGRLPQQIAVRTMIVPEVLGRPKSPAGALTCPVDEHGTWSWELPAGKLDLTLSVEGFMPHYFWGLNVPALGTHEIPAVELKRGASLAGWVAIDGGKIDPETCVALLAPAAHCGTDLKGALLMSATARKTTVGTDGFLQFTDLEAGIYALEVRQPGYAPATVNRIEVAPRQETFLGTPLVLSTPLQLDLTIEPALDSRGQPWSVKLHTTAGQSLNLGQPVQVFDGATDREGHLVAEDLSPGDLDVTVSDSAGNRVFTTMMDPWPLEHSTSRRITIPQIPVVGELRLGDEPLAATLWFGTRSGSRRVRMESSAEGSFSGVLPAEGFWRVQVLSEAPKLDTTLFSEVRTSPDREARLVIELPDTRVFGTVRDRDGRPVDRAMVVSMEHAILVWQQTGADGSFEFRGLPAGETALNAEDQGGCRTAATIVHLEEGTSTGPLELRCRSLKTVTGIVRSQGKPVAGARVTLRALEAGLGGAIADTGADGSFTVDISTEIETVLAAVAAPGYGAKQEQVHLRPGTPLSLELGHEVGTIRIVSPISDDEFTRHGLRLALYHEATELNVRPEATRVRASTEAKPSVAEISDLSPGAYSACVIEILRSSEALRQRVPEPKRVACDSGTLRAGETLELLPSVRD